MAPWRAASFLCFKALLVCGLALGLAACDRNKAEREQAQGRLGLQQTEHSHLQRQLEQAQAELVQTERALAEQQERHAASKSEQAQRSARLTQYLNSHKAAALALAASGAGAMAALDDEARHSLEKELGQGATGMAMLAGVMGAGYCLFNMDECAAVGSYLASYGMERKTSRQHQQQIEAVLQQLAQARGSQQESLQSLSQRLDASRSAMSKTESRIAQLQCKGPLCWHKKL